MQCPVCQKTCGQNETFCPRCAWEFKMFVGKAPPEEEQRLKIARRNWRLLLAKARATAKSNKKNVSDQSEPEKSSPKAPFQNEQIYSPDTLVPGLKRDAFETVKEFQKRLSDYKPILAGKALLIKEQYDINTGVFPIKIIWEKWIKSFVNEMKETCIIAQRDLARLIYESGRNHPVYALLGTDGEKAVISKIQLYALNQPLTIEKRIFQDEFSTELDTRLSELFGN